MTTTCSECGAVLIAAPCQSIFEKFLALEYADPEYGAVHFLTVSCYMIQHARYSDQALGWIEQRLRDNLEKGIPAEEIRRQAARETGQSRRTWPVTRRPEDPPQAKIAWSMTIVDVDSKYHDPASYRELVEQWARATLWEMRALLTGRE